MHSHAHPVPLYTAFSVKRNEVDSGIFEYLLRTVKNLSFLKHRMISCEGTTNKDTYVSHLRRIKTKNAYMFIDGTCSVRFIRIVTAA